MKRAFLISTLLFVAAVGFFGLAQVGPQPVAAGPAPAITFTLIYGDEDARPLVMLTEFNPWLPVIGSDSPSFVVYSTGQVIYRDRDSDDAGYQSVMLDDDGLEALLAQLNVGDDFYALDDYYDLVMITDQMTETITVWTEDEGRKRVTVYGSLYHDREARDNAPQAFLDLFDQIVSYRNRNAEGWLPEKFEVMLWPWDTSGAANWPADWPDLDSPFAIQRGADQYSIYIDIEEWDRYLELAEDERAVELGGQTWAFSVRLPFPHEVVWATGQAIDLTAEATADTD